MVTKPVPEGMLTRLRAWVSRDLLQHKEAALQAALTGVEGEVTERTAHLSRANAALEEELAALQQRYAALEQDHHITSEAYSDAEVQLRVTADGLATMSHEIRTPMNAIIGLAQVLALSEPLNARQRECVATLSISASSAMGLIGEILSLAQPNRSDNVVPLSAAELTRQAQAGRCKGRVLLIDDTNANILVGGLMLDQLGWQHDSAGSGEEALRRVDSGRYDAILMDIRMPGMDGLEATTRLRESEKRGGKPHIPVIAVTAYATRADEDKCLAAGMDAYLTKPVNIDELGRTLERVVAKQAA